MSGESEWDFGGTTADDGMLGWNPADLYDGAARDPYTSAIISFEDQTSGTTAGTGDLTSMLAPKSVGSTINFNDPGSTQPGGVALGVTGGATGGSWFDAAAKWFDDDKNGLKGATTVSLAGSFLKGIFGSFAEKGKSKNEKKMADATMMRAENEVSTQKTKFANAGSIANTNFGAAPTGLIYSNKLEPRQKRAGYGV